MDANYRKYRIFSITDTKGREVRETRSEMLLDRMALAVTPAHGTAIDALAVGESTILRSKGRRTEVKRVL